MDWWYLLSRCRARKQRSFSQIRWPVNTKKDEKCKNLVWWKHWFLILSSNTTGAFVKRMKSCKLFFTGWMWRKISVLVWRKQNNLGDNSCVCSSCPSHVYRNCNLYHFKSQEIKKDKVKTFRHIQITFLNLQFD